MSNEKELRFTIDFAKIQEADDGDTVHYGGTYEIDGLEKRGFGNDRSDSFLDEVMKVIMLQVRCKWPELYEDEGFDHLFNVESGVTGNTMELFEDGPIGQIVVYRDEAPEFQVWRE
jgi:hypothetical protein